MLKQPFFTLDDFKVAFNLFCLVFGIGSLGMPSNFSRAGPLIATLALVFMAFANTYASVVCSKVMLIAPRSVKTFGDLGEWCMGKPGRWLVVISQMGVCLLMPCAFLVLGGRLLEMSFPGAFQDKTWIVLMAISLIPIALVPTLKEGAGAALAGCLGTIVADVIGVGVLMYGMKGHPAVPAPAFSLKEVITTFGNLSLAYGAAVVIPSLQRQHSQPERMPHVIGVTLTLVSVLFLALAVAGYSAVGCQIDGNLLFSIYATPQNPVTKLGFEPDFGMIVLAFLSMQLHVTIAANVDLSPAFYIVERLFLGMHQPKPEDLEARPYEESATRFNELKSQVSNKFSVVSMADIEKTHDSEEDELSDYKGNAHKWVPTRIAIVAMLAFVAVMFADKFLDLADFIGASAISVSCIILPIVFYFKKMWTQIPMYEKIAGTTVVLVCLVMGCYVTYTSGKQLFAPHKEDPNAPVFKFCESEFAYNLYYNATEAALKAKSQL